MSKNVKIYSTSSCPYCIRLKEYLGAQNVPYENFDVGADQNALTDMRNKSGQLGVPVLDIDGKIIVGFDKPAINQELGL